MAKPLIPVDEIYERALELLDSEGAGALNARRLAADLKISTRTLYQQVGNRDMLIRELLSRHFSKLKLDFHEDDGWESTAFRWCMTLHQTLRAHPFLTELMTLDDRRAVADYVEQLVRATVRAGLNITMAVACCRSLATVTINHTIIEVRSLRELPQSPETAAEVTKIEDNFPRTIRFVIAGALTEAGL